MQNDERDPTLFKIEEPSKPRKSSKSSKSVGEIAPKVEVKASKNQPLADRMRPRNLDEFAGQAHILGPGKSLRRAIEADCIRAVIFYGPTGIGKTTLGHIIANQTKSTFEYLLGGEATIDDIRRVLKTARNRLNQSGTGTILFIDEVHRLIAAQQAPFSSAVESGEIKLIGATTENPSFVIKAPMVSRSHIYELKPLTEDDVFTLLLRACVFRGKPDTDSNSIRTAFRFRPDTVPIHIGQCSGLMSDSFWASLEWCPIWNGLLSG